MAVEARLTLTSNRGRVCGVCAGAGREVRRHTSFADLSPAAKRVLRGIETHADGSIKRVLIADLTQLELALHKVKGMHIDRRVSLNLNADLKPLKRGMSVEEATADHGINRPTGART